MTPRPTRPGSTASSFEDWLITHTPRSVQRRKLVNLMLDGRLDEVDFGSGTVRAEFRGLLDDFEGATQGRWISSEPLPFRSRRTGPNPALDLPDDGTAG